jgi:ankyrin repeat protein
MPLHVAAAYGHLDQIPKEFLTPDLLSIPTQGTKDTVLHYAALSNQPAVIPKNCISPGMWKVKNCFGLTPREYLDAARSSANYAAEKLKIQTQSSEQRPVPKGKMERIPLAKLTEETIRARTKTGDTPLHRAAKTGRISEIPRQLLQTELFMARNNSFSRETPLHLAAKYGHLDEVPREFLTRETLTASTEYEKKESCTGSTPPRTETPLHVAARCGHADQIPKEFLTPDFLSIEASGYRTTVLHDLAYSKSLDLVPDIYANSEMWNLRDSTGRTPREVLEGTIQRDTYVGAVRDEPATEKQKEKLRWFGCTWDEGITKGQASDALDACASQFPDRDAEYYSRPATEDQKAKLRSFRKNPDDNRRDGPLTYGEAKDLIRDCEREAQRQYLDSL